MAGEEFVDEVDGFFGIFFVEGVGDANDEIGILEFEATIGILDGKKNDFDVVAVEEARGFLVFVGSHTD